MSTVGDDDLDVQLVAVELQEVGVDRVEVSADEVRHRCIKFLAQLEIKSFLLKSTRGSFLDYYNVGAQMPKAKFARFLARDDSNSGFGYLALDS